MNDIFADPSVIKALATIAASIVLVAVSLVAVRVGVGNLRKAWQLVRGELPAFVGQLDEATDPFIRKLELNTGIPAAVWVSLLPAFLNALGEGLDKALNPVTPPAEAVPAPERLQPVRVPPQEHAPE